MASIIQDLYKRTIVKNLPKFVSSNIQYEVIMGSVAYGVSDDTSDMDIYGYCILPRDYVFPHLRCEIPGFIPPGPSFDQYQQHHIVDKEASGGRVH